MKVSELWLRSFIDPPWSAVELAEQLTNAGIEVGGVESVEDPKQAIWTFKVPPNRGDCLSMEGIARELSLLNRTPFQSMAVVEPLVDIIDRVPVQIKSSEFCPYYVGCVIKDINPGVPTPLWLKSRLEMAGIRSVSIIVDIMNYVMVELGQPLHAFDLAKLDSELIVRESKSGESIVLLDGQLLELKAGTLVISDGTKVQAVAGVMGGADSAVTDLTTDIFIESAYFDPVAIRLAASQYGLRTEASYRFERGVDPALQKRALKRAVQLLVEITGGKVGPVNEYKKESYSFERPVIFLRKKQIFRTLGVDFSDQEILELLYRSTLKIEVETEGYKIYPPSFRQDLVLEVDLIEEIARVYGLHRLKSEKLSGALDFFPMSEGEIPVSLFKQLLMSRGFYEVITYSFVDLALMQSLNVEDPLTLANPLSREMQAMRTSLWPGLLQAVCYNQRRQLMRLRLFELGNCFYREKDKTIEREFLAGICTGLLYQEQWGLKKRAHDFYDLKEEVEALLALGGEQSISFEKIEHPALHPGQAARVVRANEHIGYLGALHPSILKTLELEGPIFVFELKLELLKKAKGAAFRPISKFPMIRRDIAILIDKAVLAAEVRSAICECAGDFLQQVTLFDTYEGEGIGFHKKSIALSLILQHPSRTLVEGEVNNIIDNVVTTLSNRFHATLRE